MMRNKVISIWPLAGDRSAPCASQPRPRPSRLRRCLLAAPAYAGSSVSVTSNPVQGSPYEVQENQDSTLTYKLTYSIGADAEGNTPSLNSITVTFHVNNGGTIAESGSSTWTETLTKNLTSPMALSCQASGPKDGNYSVTCQATLNLSFDTPPVSNTATDQFVVSQLTVNITGDPYVVIPPNAKPTSNSEISHYTATVQSVAGDTGYFYYNWAVPSNIEYSVVAYSNGNDEEIGGYGLSTPGPATIKCDITDSNQDTSASATKQVTVAYEFLELDKLAGPSKEGVLQSEVTGQNNSNGVLTVNYTYQRLTSYSNQWSYSGGVSLTSEEIGAVQGMVGYTTGATNGTSETEGGAVSLNPGQTATILFGPQYTVTAYNMLQTLPSGTKTPFVQITSIFFDYLVSAIPGS